MKKPKILLTCPEKKDNNSISLVCNHYYIEAVSEAGGIPILSDPSYSPLKNELVEMIQGIILTGGGDIDPSFYGEKRDSLTKNVNRARDEFEIDILKKGHEKGVPILGICRGIQLINITYGGTLYQDLPHHTYNKNHIVNIKKGSFLEKIFEKEKIEVNSYHHQGIKDIAPLFENIANTDDNIIEAIVLKDNEKFILGVQWHPERMFEAFKKLFEEFVKIARRE